MLGNLCSQGAGRSESLLPGVDFVLAYDNKLDLSQRSTLFSG